MKRVSFGLVASVVCFFFLSTPACTGGSSSVANKTDSSGSLNQKGEVTLTLPAGFQAGIFADSLGSPRHITIDSNGNVYVILRGLKNGKGILRLRDTNGDGKAEDITGFGDFPGSGIAIKKGYLYASSDQEVFRFKLDPKGQVIDPDKPEKIVTGLIARNEHQPKAIALDNAGYLYVNIGAYSNACQIQDRTKGSPGMIPCPILDSAGGIWRFAADKPNQTYGDGIRYATGLRNVVGLDWNTQTNSLFVMQHGRDQLHDLFPDLYDTKQSAELPAECMYELHKGSNAGWPYIYYDQIQHKKILAPEYGGDGKKTGGEGAQDPVIAFPGHLAPNALLFYTGNQFPEKYRNGAFIAFHGSWNRAPEPQAGFFVVFVPFTNGKPAGTWEVFADGFAGRTNIAGPGDAKHRPTGLAQGPDGSLYVTDDTNGTIWKITYSTK
jgi:glucose/arabinose dehydrogenase